MVGHIRAIVYSRVSTDAQERDGTSLDAQERACEERVNANGWVLVEWRTCDGGGVLAESLDKPYPERTDNPLILEEDYALPRMWR